MKQKRKLLVANGRVSRSRSRVPHVVLPAGLGDPVPPELRVFEAEVEEALEHPHREPAGTPPVQHHEGHIERR